MHNSDQKPLVLLVEDSIPLAATYREFMKEEPIECIHVEIGKDALAILKERVPSVILLDLMLPDMNGIDILKHINKHKIATTVIVITSNSSINTVIKAMRLGAFDFLVKPLSANRLLVTLRNALEKQRLTEIVETYQSDVERGEFCGFIGTSLCMQSVYRIIENVARSRASVFITGESGTGKEVCAEAIHQRSPRSHKSFVALNCAAIPKELMESEIFGHVKGSFTSAVSDREGAASRADGGTLFLDEVCEMDIDLQSKLLRFIQTASFQRVGESCLRKVDVRFVCATNRDPLKEIESKGFREDLYYRLHVVPIHLPPLKDREDDVMIIARHFLNQTAAEEKKKFKDFAEETKRIFRLYSWPGNVRQLQNVIRNTVVLNDGVLVTPDMLPLPLHNIRGAVGKPGNTKGESQNGSYLSDKEPGMTDRLDQTLGQVYQKAPSSEKSILPLAQVERNAIEEAIRVCGGNIPKAAAFLGVSASTIYRKRTLWEQHKADT